MLTITNTHTITSPNTTINAAPPNITANTAIITANINVISNIDNKIIIITFPFFKVISITDYVKVANMQKKQ